MQEHTVKAYDDELNRLRSIISQMAGFAEAQLDGSVDSLIQRDAEGARRIMAADAKLDQLDMDAEKLAIEIMARRAPMADDLREIVAALKISTMLERIGDYAKNIAKRATVLSGTTPISLASIIPRMAIDAKSMIKDALDALIERDTARAVDVWHRDKRIDDLYNSLFRELLTYMMENPRLITPCTHLLFVAKNIERIGDQATTIAEITYYAIEGEMMKESRPKGDETSFTYVEPADEV